MWQIKKIIYIYFFKTDIDYGNMVKYRENIGKPIYRSISNVKYIFRAIESLQAEHEG